jgi:hypothetical protein
MMEVIRSFETLVLVRTIWHDIPEDVFLCKEYILKMCILFDAQLSTPVKTASSNKLEGRYLESFKLAK